MVEWRRKEKRGEEGRREEGRGEERRGEEREGEAIRRYLNAIPGAGYEGMARNPYMQKPRTPLGTCRN